jgi:hypothetical protein
LAASVASGTPGPASLAAEAIAPDGSGAAKVATEAASELTRAARAVQSVMRGLIGVSEVDYLASYVALTLPDVRQGETVMCDKPRSARRKLPTPALRFAGVDNASDESLAARALRHSKRGWSSTMLLWTSACETSTFVTETTLASLRAESLSRTPA